MGSRLTAVRERLRLRYRERLRTQILALETLGAALRSRPEDTPPRIRRLAHQLRGSGASFGFPEITAAAQAVEEADPEALGGCVEALIEVMRGACESTDPGTSAVRILIVEDDLELSGLLMAELRSPDREIKRVGSLAAAKSAVAASSPDVVLLDLLLPDGDGRSLLAELGDGEGTQTLTFVLSAFSDAPTEVECLALGAEQCFSKPFEPSFIASAVAARLAELRERQAEAQHDPLTGVLNRIGLQQAFARVAGASQRSGRTYSLALVDIDRFKQINDTLGHASGDAALIRLAEVMGARCRASDLIARWGGDEFVMVFPETDVRGTAVVVESIAALATQGEPSLSLSVGVVEGVGGVPLGDLVGRADALLYRRKARGGGGVEAEEGVRGRPLVLVVEDDPGARDLIVRVLAEEGMETRSCASLADARQLLAELQPRLVVLDRRLEDGDGFELLSDLAGRERVRVMILTAVGSVEDIEAAFAAGADEYMLKPFSPLEMLARAKRLIWREGR